MQVFVTINSVRIVINVDANVKNLLIKIYVIKDMLGILVIVNVNAINYAMLASISIMKTVSVEVALFEHVNECVCSYTVFIVLGVIVVTICIGIGPYFTYKYIKRNKNVSIYDYLCQARIY